MGGTKSFNVISYYIMCFMIVILKKRQSSFNKCIYFTFLYRNTLEEVPWAVGRADMHSFSDFQKLISC